MVGGVYADEPAVAIEGVVELLHPGRFTLDGPWLAGVEAWHGRTATVRCGSVLILLTERSAMSQDTAFFRTLGIDVSQMDLVVVKSGYHFRLSFEGVATPLIAATTGPAMYDRMRGGLKRAPVWPETATVPPVTSPRVRQKVDKTASRLSGRAGDR